MYLCSESFLSHKIRIFFFHSSFLSTTTPRWLELFLLLTLHISGERILGLLTVGGQLLGLCTRKGRLPRHTVATAYYGEEPKSTSAMDFTEKLCINLLFPDESLKDVSS